MDYAQVFGLGVLVCDPILFGHKSWTVVGVGVKPLRFVEVRLGDVAFGLPFEII
jgi:hypothetical protein